MALFSLLLEMAKPPLPLKARKVEGRPQDNNVRTSSAFSSNFTHSPCNFLRKHKEEVLTACSKRDELSVTHMVKEQGQPPLIPPTSTRDCQIQMN